MTREALVGRWLVKGSRRNLTWILHPDGSVSQEVNGVLRQSDDTAEWKFVDERHWQLRVTIPPRPDTRGLEDGAVEVVDYEVLRFAADEMELQSFDSEPEVYVRMRA
jgi:hypothetical protein